MRTKTLLLTAALCAAGAASSMAQVYSINVVGYVQNVASAGKFSMWANPLDKAGGNSLTNVLANPTGGAGLQLWNGLGWDAYTFSAGSWRLGATPVNGLLINPGKGFFIKPSVSQVGGFYTNIFVGTVIPNPGSIATNPLPITLQAVGVLTPFSDTITNTSSINIKGAGGWTLQKWQPTFNAGAGGFQAYGFSAGQWRIGATVTNPVINAGEGFFIKATATAGTNWTTTY